MVNNIKNTMVNPRNKFDYSRSAFNYKNCHGTNLSTGYIVPVQVFNLMPGDTIPKKFGFVLQSAPLLGPSVDNIYIDIIGAWCPTRLVMGDHNEWLGDNDQYAWTLGNHVSLPKITNVNLIGVEEVVNGTSYFPKTTPTYMAEHYLAPHIGCRWLPLAGSTGLSGITLSLGTAFPSTSRFYNGLSVIPSRSYDLIWNRIFRNQNIQDPVLISKQSGFDLSIDVGLYKNGLGQLRRACRLKNFFTTAWISPSIQSVSIGNFLPVIPRQGATIPFISGRNYPATLVYDVGGNTLSGKNLGVGTSSTLGTASGSSYAGDVPIFANLWADMSSLTVNSLYYSIMLQRYMNKASEGRRPVEFYKEYFGIDKSNAIYDDPELVFHKRYPVNISRVIATGNSTDLDGNVQPLGTQGAYSLTSVGDSMPEFTSTEYGTFFIFAVIRTQESISTGCDRYLTDGELLSTYLPVFDHIGKDYIDLAELSDYFDGKMNIFGYQDAWYQDRYTISTNVGIFSPGEPLDYMTLARDFTTKFTINSEFVSQSAKEFDRMLQLPTAYSSPYIIDSGTGELETNEFGELYNQDRYQWVINFCCAGDFVRTMSKDSEQLLFGVHV